MNPVTVKRGDGPVILGQPHSGTYVPLEISDKLNALGKKLIDTDWHVGLLYDGLLDGASVVRANFHRYVIDANRDPSGQSLYPGQNTTSLVPLTTFDGDPIWETEPDQSDVQERLARYHQAYHDALQSEIEWVTQAFGGAVLYDCHSIRSEIPFLFEGRLPVLNVGDNSGATCAPEIMAAVEAVCAEQDDYDYIVNGRFRGGWTTRHYGDPENNVHAIQMELAQYVYLKQETAPFEYDTRGASALRDVLKKILNNIQDEFIRRQLTEPRRDENA